jgi:hypothetical protein
MNSPISSPQPAEFQAHIYNSFLQGDTADVALRIRASWNAIYNSHRVVLIQAVRVPLSSSVLTPETSNATSRTSSVIYLPEDLLNQRLKGPPYGLAFPRDQ